MTRSTAIYALPGEQPFYRVTGQARAIPPASIFQSPGFVFAPFDPNSEAIYRIDGLPEKVDLSTMPEEDWKLSNRTIPGDDWYSYQNMYQAAQEAIRNGSCEKIVLSLRDIEAHPITSIPELLLNLRQAYPDAFVYAFYIPEKELWIGASPELLLDTNWPEQRTVALAGTLKNAPHWEDWPEKERQEHRFVEQFIEEELRDRSYRKNGPRPIPAGPVYHLVTDYILSSDPESTQSVVDPFLLHPGPALSGYPVPQSIEAIQRIELSPRRYYTGFLGPVWDHSRSRMFINLRCLEMLAEYQVLYAGGGLTAESEVENEWMEIQYKLSTLRSKIYKGHKIP